MLAHVGNDQWRIPKSIDDLRIDAAWRGDLISAFYPKLEKILGEHRLDDLLEQPIGMDSGWRAWLADRADHET
jgi:hypothetical protein